jgi:hypothetical protein
VGGEDQMTTNDKERSIQVHETWCKNNPNHRTHSTKGNQIKPKKLENKNKNNTLKDLFLDIDKYNLSDEQNS